jgi:transcriptional regulator with XRE-family HTH domain
MSTNERKTLSTPIPKRLKQARKAVDLSQKDLGVAAGMDELSASARMNQYEVGKRTPDYSTLKRIAKVLGYPPAYFYTEDDLMAELISCISKLSREEKQALLLKLS